MQNNLLYEANEGTWGAEDKEDVPDGEGDEDASPIPLEEILASTNAKSYCEAFSKDINTIGNIDCANLSADIVDDTEIGSASSQTANIVYDCARTYNFEVGADGTKTETYDPIRDYNNIEFSKQPLCENNQTDDKSLTCKATPDNALAELLNTNKQEQLYSCSKASGDLPTLNSNGGSGVAEVDFAQDDIFNKTAVVKTLNNINLRFITYQATQTPASNSITANYTYNLKANLSQDEICPLLDLSRLAGFNYASPPNIYPEIKLINYHGTDSAGSMLSNMTNYTINSCSASSELYCIIAHSASCNVGSNAATSCNGKNNAGYATTGTIVQNNPSINVKFTGTNNDLKISNVSVIKTLENFYYNTNTNSCFNLLNYIDKLTSPSNDTSSKNQYFWLASTAVSSKIQDNTKSIVQAYAKIFMNTNLSSYKELSNYKNKWNNFFTKNSSYTKATKAAIEQNDYDEGTKTKTHTINGNSSITSITTAPYTHFIYVSIDKPFYKDDFGLNKYMFVFE